MKREKIGKRHLFKTKSRTPFAGITFIALQENDQEEIPTSEYINYILINSSIKNLCSKSSWLSNYITKLSAGEERRNNVEFIEEDNIFGIIKFLPADERKGFFLSCCKMIQAEMVIKNYKYGKRNSDIPKLKDVYLSSHNTSEEKFRENYFD